MNCPYCNAKMKLGQIEADNLLSWKPDGERSTGAQDGQRAPIALCWQNTFYWLLHR